MIGFREGGFTALGANRRLLSEAVEAIRLDAGGKALGGLSITASAAHVHLDGVTCVKADQRLGWDSLDGAGAGDFAITAGSLVSSQESLRGVTEAIRIDRESDVILQDAECLAESRPAAEPALAE